MRLPLLLATLLCLTTSLGSSAAEVRLAGCPEPASIVKALAELGRSDWREVSLTRLQALWPRHLIDLGCESAKGCILVGTQDRIIEGHCECCQVFEFDLKRDQEGPRSEQLAGITIHYSARRRKDVLDVASRLARASGIPEAEAKTVGRDTVQKFQWENTRQEDGELSVMDVRLSRRGPLWTLYLSVARHYMSR